MSTSGRGRVEERLAASAVKLIDRALSVVSSLQKGDTDAAEAQAVQLARAAVRNAEALAKLDGLGPRLRNFYRRQSRRKR